MGLLENPNRESQLRLLGFWSKVMPFSEDRYSLFEKQLLIYSSVLADTKGKLSYYLTSVGYHDLGVCHWIYEAIKLVMHTSNSTSSRNSTYKIVHELVLKTQVICVSKWLRSHGSPSCCTDSVLSHHGLVGSSLWPIHWERRVFPSGLVYTWFCMIC